MPRKPPGNRFRNKPQLRKKRVYATAAISIALLHAVIRTPSWAWSWRYAYDEEGKFRLYVWPQPGQRLFVKRYGYVYIVPRSTFQSVQSVLIYGSHASVKPAEVIRVSVDTVFEILNKEGCRFVREYSETEWPEPVQRLRSRPVKIPW